VTRTSRLLHRTLTTAGTTALVLAAVTPAATGSGQPSDNRQPIRIVTIAGTGQAGYSGDGGDALDARLNDLLRVDVDSHGNVYIADQLNRRLRVVSTDGTIDTVPGTRGERSPENDGPDIGGFIYSPSNTPQSLAVDADDNLYIAAAQDIRRRDAEGRFTVITTSDGEESFGDGENGGDGGPASNAFIYEPSDVTVDGEGNLYIADTNHNRIRKVDTSGTITTIAGGGDLDRDESEGGPATEASVFSPESVAVDSQGNVYFTEDLFSRDVRKVDTDGTITTVVGLEPEGFSGDGGPAPEAQLSSTIAGVAVDADDNLYIADYGNSHIRKVDAEGTITTIPALFPDIEDVAVGPEGDLYVAGGGQVKRMVQSGGPTAADADGTEPEASPPEHAPWADEQPGTIVTVAGAAYEEPEDGPLDGPPGGVPSEGPSGVAVDTDGNVYIADTGNHRIGKVESDGTITTIAGADAGAAAGAGSDEQAWGDGGPAIDATLDSPEDIAVDADGNIYIADTGHSRIRKIDTNGTITTIAGVDVVGDEQASGDGGPAVDAELNTPGGIAVDPEGNLYVADTGHSRIRKIDTNGTITTIAGGGELWADAADNAPATEASLWEPVDVSVDPDGNVYLIEGRHQSVRRVNTDGTLVTVAGDSYLSFDEGGFSGDGGPAAEAELNTPGGTAVDADGNLYIADTYNSRIRKVDTNGTITTIAGTGEPRDNGDGGRADEAGLDEPRDIAVDADGRIFLMVGSRSDRVRRVDPEGTITTLAEIGSTEDDDRDGGPATEAQLGGPDDIAVDADGNLYIADTDRIDTDGTIHAGHVRMVDTGGTISTVEGDPAGEALGRAAAVTIDADGRIFLVADGRVKRRDPDGIVTTIAGGGTLADDESTDGSAVVRQVGITASISPADVAVGAGGDVYIAATDAILKLTSDGTLTAIVEEVRDFGHPDAVAVDTGGNLYVASSGVTDATPGHIHKVESDGTITTIAGNDDDPVPGDDIGDGGPAADAVLSNPTDVAVDADGNVYVSEREGVRKIDPDGTITTVAESPREEQEDGSLTTTTYTSPTALALDADGNLYFAEPATHRVRVIVRPADIPTSGSSRWGTVVRGMIGLLVVALVVVGIRRRRQLANLLRDPRRLAVNDDDLPTPSQDGS
jgi:sugar lactone lactonase YvrE